MKVKLGPISMQYTGTGRFVERDEAAAPGGGRGQGQGQARQRHGRGTVTATLTAAGDASTEVTVTTDLNITGKPAQFGRGVMQDVSDKLLAQFASCLETKLGESRGCRRRAGGRRALRRGALSRAEEAGSEVPAPSPRQPEPVAALDLGTACCPGAAEAVRAADHRGHRRALVAPQDPAPPPLGACGRPTAGLPRGAARRPPSGAMTTPDSEQTQCGSGPSSGSIDRLCSTGRGSRRRPASAAPRRTARPGRPARPARRCTTRPACHCDSHHRRCDTQSSTTDTVCGSTSPCAARSRSTSARAVNSGSARRHALHPGTVVQTIPAGESGKRGREPPGARWP